MIDELWTVRDDRGFTWTGHRLAQRLDASPIVQSRDLPVSVITVRTTVVRNVGQGRREVEGILARLNVLAVGSAYQFIPDRREVIAISRHVVHEETLETRSEELADHAILQLCFAEHQAETLSTLVQGTVAHWQHPITGARLVRDEMLNVVRDVFAPAGQEASRFEDAAEMERAAALLNETPFASLGTTAKGLCIEVPFGERNTTLIEIASDALHPSIGSGLAVATLLPYDHSEDELVAVAAELQAAQSETIEGGGQFGGWALRTHRGRQCVAYCRFVPNAMFRPGVVADAVLHEVSRALWVDERAFPGLPARDAWTIMASRDGLL
jgi:hypothetical protein